MPNSHLNAISLRQACIIGAFGSAQSGGNSYMIEVMTHSLMHLVRNGFGSVDRTSASYRYQSINFGIFQDHVSRLVKLDDGSMLLDIGNCSSMP